MRKMTLAIVLAALGIGGWAMFTQGEEPKKKERPDPKTVKALMGKKLDHSQKLLGFLVTNDLEKAGKQAEELIRVRKEVAWMIFKTKDYEMWSDEFNQSADKIIKAAKDKNLDAAKLAYLEMTLTCFHCHAYVRDLGGISTLAPFER